MHGSLKQFIERIYFFDYIIILHDFDGILSCDFNIIFWRLKVNRL